ncbi:hypothetical protein MKK63_01950 [Methylobacterium sp. J-088]|uniref:hypothetical protein n=1 Tax=Methylobacterium sp. J-088 TaxID=2836664 RepID=UPI001FBBB6A1|nr:hypothetical protein [Methylobacterium sp. J-088]MCJ2061476.1 hypothetical protein [Methylobacterium sp. J-088]
MSVSTFVTGGHKIGFGTGIKVSAVKRKSFWSGVLQGLSGPSMMGAQPEVLNNMVEVRNNKINLKTLEGSRSYAFNTQEDASIIAQALTEAMNKIATNNHLLITTEIVRRLDQEGKLRQVRRPKVMRRAQNGPE